MTHYATCPTTGKRSYADRIGALLAVAGCKRHRKGSRRERRIYRCRYCAQWHLTSQERRS